MTRPPAAPDHALAGAVALHRAGRAAEAEAAYRAILATQPNHAGALSNLAMLLRAGGAVEEPLALYRRALAVDPDFTVARVNLGNALNGQGDHEAAEAAFREALERAPANADAQFGLGYALHRQGRLEDAMVHYHRALALDPGHSDAALNRAAVLQAWALLPAAAAAYRDILERRPGDAKALLNLGATLTRLGQLAEAAAVLRRALALKPDYADAALNLSNVHLAAGEAAEAVAVLRQPPAAPLSARDHGNLLFALNYLPNLSDQAMLAEYRDWNHRHAAPLTPAAPTWDCSPEPGRRLRVGYVSPDFCVHSVAYFIEPALAHHDRAGFEVVCYSDVVAPDAVTARLRALADLWRPVSALSDEALARLVRADRIDVLVDLAGHSGQNRLLAFARKPAPVQVTWLGYPNTTGLAAMDYRITDAVADPEGADALYTEMLARLPRGFLCYRPPDDAPGVGPLPALARGHVTFGSFNNLAKTTPEVIGLWAALLTRVPGARMVLKNCGLADEGCRRRYLDLFAAGGVAPGRVDLLPWIKGTARHLADYGGIDIALDTFPYAGTTTTCEALWMGAPVVTLLGRRHAGRVGASLLSRLGLQRLIARDEAAYLEIAAGLAADLPALADLRAGLRATMAASPLCDGAFFARSLETAYTMMWRRWRAGFLSGHASGEY